MNTYEVTYLSKGDEKVARVEATTPQEAMQIFLKESSEKDVIVLCVVRH